MKKNRKIPKKMSVAASNTMHFAALIVVLCLMVILNLLASSSCTQLMKTIGEKERMLVKLEDAKMREATRWEELKTPERVAEALRAHGLAMETPRSYQVVRMRGDGTPFPGQPSVARARQRNGSQTVQYRRRQR
jgi:hypothetical protein